MTDKGPARRRHRCAFAGAARLRTRVHALRQPHHVGLRCRARDEARSRACAPRGGRRAHGGCVGAADGRGRHRDGHRRAGPRQCGRRALHGARRGVADGAAVGPCRDMGARPRRLPGNPPGRHGGAGEQSLVDRDVRGDARPRHRRGDPHRDLGPAGAGAPQPAVRPAGGARREQRDRLAGCARPVGRAGARRCGRGCGARRDRVRGAADHLRGSAAVERERARAARAARSRDAKRPPSSWKARAASRMRRSARSPTWCAAPT